MATGSRGGAPLTTIFAKLNPTEFEHIDIMDGEFEVLRKADSQQSEFILRSQNETVAFYVVVMDRENATIEQAYVAPEARGQRLTEKFCWFLQTRMNKKILFGQHMSNDAIALARSLAQSKRFRLFWVRGDEREPFDPDEAIGDEIDDGTHWAYEGPTGWRLIAESRHPQVSMITEMSQWTCGHTYNLFDDY
jgi:hypothetical protein